MVEGNAMRRLLGETGRKRPLDWLAGDGPRTGSLASGNRPAPPVAPPPGHTPGDDPDDGAPGPLDEPPLPIPVPGPETPPPMHVEG